MPIVLAMRFTGALYHMEYIAFNSPNANDKLSSELRSDDLNNRYNNKMYSQLHQDGLKENGHDANGTSKKSAHR